MKGKQLQLRWDPKYVEPLQGIYVDVWLGLYMIWSSSPYMYHQVIKRERDQQYYIIKNQYLPLQTIVKAVSRSPVGLTTIRGVEGCLPLIPLLHLHQMVGFAEVELSEDGGPLVRSRVKLGVRAQ